MKVNVYRLLSDQIEAGIRGGLMKCEKRDYFRCTDSVEVATNFNAAVEEIHGYIMNSIGEYFEWEDEDDYLVEESNKPGQWYGKENLP